MSYLVLARKYRPQTFADLVGQDHVTRTLTNAIRLNRIAHGYLFTGTRGVGKTTVARIFAKSLNCESAAGPTPEPCGHCRSCRDIANSSSQDVFEIDAASNTSVDDVRELRENVKYLPASSRFKVYIIDEVHMLSRNAFNALLKTLEEPPPHVVFIFATTEPHRIPDTVLSRTQQYEFKMIGLAEIADYLARLMEAEGVPVPRDVVMLVARKAAGSVRDGLSYMDQVLSYGPDRPLAEIADVLGVVDRQALAEISAAVLRADPVAVLGVLEKLGTSNWDVKDLLADLLEHFRNLVAVKLAPRPERLIDAGEAELAVLAAQVKNVAPATLEHLFHLLADSEELILRSGQPRLVLEMTLVRLAQGARVDDLEGLIRRIGELKTSIAAGTLAPRAPSAAPRDDGPTPRDAEPPPNPERDPARALAAGLRRDHVRLAVLMGENPVEIEGNVLRISLPSGFAFRSFERDIAGVTRVAAEVFDRDLKVVLVQTETAAANPIEDRFRAEREAEENRREAARAIQEHPAFQWAREVFPDADIKFKPTEKHNDE